MAFGTNAASVPISAGIFAVGLPTLAAQLSDSPTALGWMLSGWGVGQLIGALSAAITGLPRRWGLLIIAMTFIEGAVFATLGFTSDARVAAVLLGLLGVGVAYSTDVALPTFIQTTTPRELLGRVSSVLGLPRVLFEPVSIALLGYALSRSLHWGFIAAAIPVLISGVIVTCQAKVLELTTDEAG